MSKSDCCLRFRLRLDSDSSHAWLSDNTYPQTIMLYNVQGMSQLSVSGAVTQTLAKSNFKKHYSRAKTPQFQHEFLGSVHKLLIIYCRYVSSCLNIDYMLFNASKGKSFPFRHELLDFVQRLLIVS